MKQSNFHIIVLMIGVFFLSTSAIFVKVLDAPAVVIAFYRLFFSGLFMLPIVLANKNLRSEVMSFTTKQVLLGCISGVLLAGHYVLWFKSLDYTSVASSTVLVTLQPVFAVIGGYLFFKERVNFFGIAGMIIAIFGSGFIGWQDFQSSSIALYGDFLALLAAIIITGYFFIGQNLRQHMSVLAYSIIGYFSSSIVLFAYGSLQKTSFIGFEKSTWILFIAMALFSTIFGQLVINWVLKWLKTTTVSVVILTEVVWATLLSVVVLDEWVTGKQVIGIVVIILGLLVYAYREKIELRFKGNPREKAFLKDNG